MSYSTERQARIIAQGRCVDCQELRAPDGGKRRCRSCLDGRKEIQERRMKYGLCRYHNVPAHGFKTCFQCRLKLAQATKRYSERRKAA